MVEFLYMFILLVCSAGLGKIALGRMGICLLSRAEELVFSLGIGLGILSLSLFILGQFQLYYTSVFYALVLIGGLIGHKELVGFAGRIQGVLGQTQLNSGIEIETVYFLCGYRLSTISKSLWLGLEESGIIKVKKRGCG